MRPRRPRRSRQLAVPPLVMTTTLVAAIVFAACGSEVTLPGGGGTAATASGAGGAGATAGGGAGAASSSAGGLAGAGGSGAAAGAGGAAPTCLTNLCQGHMYPCGDCLDNDGDGLVDMADPECTGPCDNTEDSFYSWVMCATPCMQDCHFDQDFGGGNDDCRWTHVCDPLEVPPDYYPEPYQGPKCAHDPNIIVPGTMASCAEQSAAQSSQCLDYCGAIKPNGCDCFGCCQYPPGSSSYFFLGSEGVSASTVCTSDKLGDPTVCHPCTPVPACLNPCDTCELCLAKTTLPPSCGGQQVCPPGAQACGLDGQPLCPEGYFCLTGCCAQAPV